MQALIFPGQGAQFVGMARDLYERYEPVKALYQRANDALGFDVATLSFEGPEESLKQSAHCQPALLTASLAALTAAEEVLGAIECRCTGGVSLGEYTALVAADILDFQDAVSLVHKRGRFMEEAAKGTKSGMASVLGLALDKVKEACEQSRSHGVITVANVNDPTQTVLSGELEALARASERCREAGAKRVITLKVSGAFHSPLMKGAEEKLRRELEKLVFRKPKVEFVSNVTADSTAAPEEIKDRLARQLTSTVLWEGCVRFMTGKGVDRFLELGPGKTLSGMVKRIDTSVTRANVGDCGTLDALKEKRLHES